MFIVSLQCPGRFGLGMNLRDLLVLSSAQTGEEMQTIDASDYIGSQPVLRAASVLSRLAP